MCLRNIRAAINIVDQNQRSTDIKDGFMMNATNEMNSVTPVRRSGLRKGILGITLVAFAALSTWVMLDNGYWGIWQAGFTSSGSLQILIDLAIGCFLICSWIIGDARARGVNPVPWVIATLTTGTIAPLLYLLVREYQIDRSNALKTSPVGTP
jgi:hypothetical protein